MSKIIAELKQHGVIATNKVKRNSPDQIEVVEIAYKRAKELNSIICPRCWVINNVKSLLEIEAFAEECNVYRCAKCNFNAALPKTETHVKD